MCPEAPQRDNSKIFIHAGKGTKDRYPILAAQMKETLVEYPKSHKHWIELPQGTSGEKYSSRISQVTWREIEKARNALHFLKFLFADQLFIHLGFTNTQANFANELSSAGFREKRDFHYLNTDLFRLTC